MVFSYFFVSVSERIVIGLLIRPVNATSDALKWTFQSFKNINKRQQSYIKQMYRQKNKLQITFN